MYNDTDVAGPFQLMLKVCISLDVVNSGCDGEGWIENCKNAIFVLCGNQLLLVDSLLLLSVYSGTGKRRKFMHWIIFPNKPDLWLNLLKLLISINSTKLLTFCLRRKTSHSVQYNGEHFVVLVLDGVFVMEKKLRFCKERRILLFGCTYSLF